MNGNEPETNGNVEHHLKQCWMIIDDTIRKSTFCLVKRNVCDTRELRVPDHAMAFFGLAQVESIQCIYDLHIRGICCDPSGTKS